MVVSCPLKDRTGSWGTHFYWLRLLITDSFYGKYSYKPAESQSCWLYAFKMSKSQPDVDEGLCHKQRLSKEPNK